MAMSPTPPSSAVPGAVVALGWDPEGTMVLAGGPGGQLTLWGDNGVMARGTVSTPLLPHCHFGVTHVPFRVTNVLLGVFSGALGSAMALWGQQWHLWGH